MTLPLIDPVRGVEPVRGFVETPECIVDLMVEKLFRQSTPSADSTLLDPGCGPGGFIDGVLRWCSRTSAPVPQVTGIEADPSRAEMARYRFRHDPRIEICQGDFLEPQAERFDYIIGNPPYVPISGISPAFRDLYRRNYISAKGRFDLYLLFYEQALSLLRDGGRLVFITPEKFLYVETAVELRRLLGKASVEELHFLDEETFGGFVTYPLVTTVTARTAGMTRIVMRDAVTRSVRLPEADRSWLPAVLGAPETQPGPVLADICLRISCGIATGADSVFLVPLSGIPDGLSRFAYPTIAGRDIILAGKLPASKRALLVPYDPSGNLIPETELGYLRAYLAEPSRRVQLEARTCARRKPWYAFHETPPMTDVLRPKLMCKDIGARPTFVVDAEGAILPRHSVYYIVPRNPDILGALQEYLNSEPARDWLASNCQRATNGFLRVQSHVLKQLPVPGELVHGFSPVAVRVDTAAA